MSYRGTPMKVLVTGGLGFIGSHLVDHLLLNGLDVTIVDNESTSCVPADHFAGRANCLITDVSKYNPEERFDRIYHLACVVGPAGVLPHAGLIGPQIMHETAHVTEMALAMNARLLSISTSELYGRPGSFKEEEYKVVPSQMTIRLEYAVGKLLTEISILNRCRVTELRANLVRPFNIAGPRQSSRGGFVLPRFIAQAVKGEDLTVFGDGTQIRTLTHVRDTVDGLAQVMNSDVRGEIFNIGHPGNTVTMTELAERVIRITKSKSRVVLVDPRTVYGHLYDEAFNKIPEISKMGRFFGWTPKIGVDELIEDTYRWWSDVNRL